jgi:hypothetical protein
LEVVMWLQRGYGAKEEAGEEEVPHRRE